MEPALHVDRGRGAAIALTGLRLHFEAGTKIHPGRLENWIAFSMVRPAARRHDAISSIDHVPDALVSAK